MHFQAGKKFLILFRFKSVALLCQLHWFVIFDDTSQTIGPIELQTP